MARSAREQMMIGGLALIGGVAVIGGLLVLPEFDKLSANQKQAETLRGEITQLEGQQTTLNQNIQRYETGNNIPNDLVIRTYDETTKASVLKEMLDKIVGIASNASTVFISLEPFDASQDNIAVAPPAPANGQAPPAAGAATPAPATPAPAAGTPPVANGAAAAAPVQPQLMTYGYTMAIRGNYGDVQKFLGSLNSHHELIELSSIKVENEAGPQRQIGNTATPLLDPTKPIKLTAKIKLILLPKTV